MGVLVLLLAGLVPVTLVVVLVTALAGAGRRSRPENTPAATLVAARRHENIASTLGLLGGIAVAAVLVGVAGNGARLIPGPPGLVAALGPTAGALVHLLVQAVGERTWPRPEGALRTAVLRRRTVREIAGRLLDLVLATTVSFGVALVLFALTADETGRAVTRLITPADASAGIVDGASGPYPGAPYALPMLVGLVVVLAGTLGVLHLVARRPAVTGTLPEDDLGLRRTSASRTLGGVQLFVGGQAAVVLLVAANALGNAGWSLAAWLSVALGLGTGLLSLIVTARAFGPGAPWPRRESTAVGTARS